MIEKYGFKIEPAVFFPAAAFIFATVATVAIAPAASEAFLAAIKNFIAANFGWFYILVVTGFLFFVVYLGFSRYGSVKLGDPDEEPEFGTWGWFAMLFSAGMGIGLLYNGVGEPLWHYNTPPLAEPRTLAAADESLLFTFYHWGFHPWAIYSVVGLSVAYFGYRMKMPVTLRSAFYPLFGERIRGPIGHTIDVFAVVGTMFGVAASLAVGAKQIAAGLNAVTGIPGTTTTEILVIAFVTAVATVSVLSGLHKGIRRLSTANLILSGCFLLFIFIVGPTIFMLDSFVQNFGNYIEILLQTGFWTDPWNRAGEWQESWTLAYWGWWLAWAPFVGMFIARISRGRTIREFVMAVLIVPTVVSFFWFSIAGDTAIQTVRNGADTILPVLEQVNGLDVVMFEFLEYLPFTAIASMVVVVAVFIFFVTSSDSGSLVIDMLAAGGDPNPPAGQRVFWAFTEGLVAAVMILAGGLPATRALVSAAGLPVAILLILMCVALYKALRMEREGLMARLMEDARSYRERHGLGPPETAPLGGREA